MILMLSKVQCRLATKSKSTFSSVDILSTSTALMTKSRQWLWLWCPCTEWVDAGMDKLAMSGCHRRVKSEQWKKVQRSYHCSVSLNVDAAIQACQSSLAASSSAGFKQVCSPTSLLEFRCCLLLVILFTLIVLTTSNQLMLLLQCLSLSRTCPRPQRNCRQIVANVTWKMQSCE